MGFLSIETCITDRIDALLGVERITEDHSNAIQDLCTLTMMVDDGVDEAARTVRKRLQDGDAPTQINAIMLIHAMLEACGCKFSVLVAAPRFLGTIESTVKDKYTHPVVRARMMSYLYVWSSTFASDPGLTAIPQLYSKLAPNYAPAPEDAIVPITLALSAGTMAQETRGKQILQDVEVATGNAQLLLEAVSFVDPEKEAVEENELIKEFRANTMESHRKIALHLSQMTDSAEQDPAALASLLNCNQELVQAIKAHSTMLESRQQYIASIDSRNPFTDDKYSVDELEDRSAAVRNGKQPERYSSDAELTRQKEEYESWRQSLGESSRANEVAGSSNLISI